MTAVPLRLTSSNITHLHDYLWQDAVLRSRMPDHPRVAANPMPAARWSGVEQWLHSGASADAFVPYTTDCGSATVAALNKMRYKMGSLTGRMILPYGHGREVNGKPVLPRDQRILILDTIDRQLHQGHPIAIAVDYKRGHAAASDGLSDHWLYITDRQYLADKTVYYLAQDNAFGRDKRYFVNVEDLSLVCPSPNAGGRSYTVVNVTPHKSQF